MTGGLFWADFGFGLVTASILAFGAVAFTMQYGITAVPNFAFGDQMTVAAYAAWLLNTALHWPLWLAGVVGSLFMALFSVAMGRLVIAPFVRKRANLFTLLVVTFLFGLVLQNAVQLFFSANFQSYANIPENTVHVGPMVFTTAQLAILAVAVLAMLAMHGVLQYTRVGVAMRALADNRALARTCGIPTERVLDLVWALTGFLCGLAGFVLTLDIGSLTPTSGAGFLLVIVAAAVLGGVGRPYGAMLGALLVGLATELSVLYLPAEDKTVVAFLILLLVLLLRPQGILASPGKG
jgi:branched-subunit amino acid ABC-type transport system permease component